MNISLDYGYRSINHFGEEVCGDRVNIRQDKNRFIGVLADGMGSGVKANILSTMGSTILSTMLHGGEDLESAVDVVIRSLPVCSERGMNYCTFSVVSVDDRGVARLVEFDNPQAWIIRNRQVVQPERQLRQVEEFSRLEEHLLPEDIPYEDMTFSVPAKYDEYLRHWYGDRYMELLPISSRKSGHNLKRMDLGKYLFAETENLPSHVNDLRGELYEKPLGE